MGAEDIKYILQIRQVKKKNNINMQQRVIGKKEEWKKGRKDKG